MYLYTYTHMQLSKHTHTLYTHTLLFAAVLLFSLSPLTGSIHLTAQTVKQRTEI